MSWHGMLFRSLRIALWENKGLKLFALALAVLLWLNLVSRGVVSKEIREIPWQVRNLPSDMEIVARSAERINVTVRGLASTLQRLPTDDLVIDLELPKETEPGKRTIYLSEKDIPIPRGVAVVKIDPVQLTLNLERKREKEVPIQAVLRGEPAADHHFRRFTMHPDRVLIQGAESQLSMVQTVQTAPIVLDGARSATEGEVALILPDPFAGTELEGQRPNLLRFKDRTSIRYRLDIIETVGVRLLELPVGVQGQPDHLKIEPERAEVLIQGGRDRLRHLRPEDLFLTAAPVELAPGERCPTDLELRDLPEGLVVLEILTDVQLVGQSPSPGSGDQSGEMP